MVDLSDFLSPLKAVLLRSRTKEQALEELANSLCKDEPSPRPHEVLEAIWKREKIISSWIASGVAIPHARLPGLGRFMLAVGRSREGIVYDSGDAKPVHLLFLILGDEEQPDQHILLLAEIARLLKDATFQKQLLDARSKDEFHQVLLGIIEAPHKPPEINKQKLTLMIVNHALAVAREVRAKAVLVHTDALGATDYINGIGEREKIILVIPGKAGERKHAEGFARVLVAPFPGLNRTNQVEMSLLFGVSEGLFRSGDRVVSVSGAPDSGFLDTLMVIDVGAKFSPFLSSSTSAVLADLNPGVLERALQIAMDLAREGREGRPVGAIFVIGDYEQVVKSCRQMVINPFRGYRDDEKSIMDPFLEETIKEFATIDGAFVIRGDGVLMSAGAFLKPEKTAEEFPAGLGARHTAAAAITASTAAFSVVISQSTGVVSVFRNGKRILALEKSN